MKTLVLLFAFLLLVTGCVSLPSDDFAKLKPGMEKSEVLEVMGNPTYKVRRKGQDRWTWVYYDKNEKLQSEVHFDDGKAVYVGGKPKPELSAEERDSANEQANLEIEKQFNAEREAARDNLPNYEDEVRGSGSDGYIPTYQPVQ